MTTIKLTEKNPMVLIFDGNILEIFSSPRQWDFHSERIHLFWLEKFELWGYKNGTHGVYIRADGHDKEYPVDENIAPKVKDLIAEIQRARDAFRFD
jgi:hypothetical protein